MRAQQLEVARLSALTLTHDHDRSNEEERESELEVDDEHLVVLVQLTTYCFSVSYLLLLSDYKAMP
jgi:hypothetical protein